MRILGIDPGIGRLGWGVVEIQGSKLIAQNFGCIETKANSKAEERLLIIDREIGRIIKANKPDALSIEDLFFGANSKTAFSVGQARGVVLLAAARTKLPVFIYTPLEVKMALTGYGRAEKSQVAQMVKVILGLKVLPKLDDTTDALAIAITHSFSAKMEKIKS